MLVADTYLGTAGELDADRLDTVTGEDTSTGDGPLHILIDDADRQRSRFRTTSECGRDVGVAVGRTLRDGDVLDADGTLVLVELEPIPALAVPLEALEPAEAVAVGHALGNRHRDLAIQSNTALVPAGTEAKRRERTLREVCPDDVPVERTAVAPSVFDDGTTWAAAAAGGDTHTHDHAASGEDQDSHTHDHDRSARNHARGEEP